MVKKNAELTKEKNLRAKVLVRAFESWLLSNWNLAWPSQQALKEAKATGKPAPANPMAKRASKVAKKTKKAKK